MSDIQFLCSLFLLVILFLAAFLLRRIVKLYSIDVDEYVHFLGFRFLHSCPFGFTINIPVSMLKRSYTDQFLLLVPEDILGSSYNVSLIVTTKEGRYSAAFSKKTHFSIPISEWGL